MGAVAPLEDTLRSIGRVEARAVPDDVYDVLLGMLTSGELPAHSPLSIDRIAKSLNVSQTPVREALARLEHTGLVERAARRGYRVAPPMSKSNMAELADARLIMEIGAIERAMVHLDELLPALEAALGRHEKAAAQLLESPESMTKGNVKEYFDEDWSFHQAFLDHCNNRYIERSVNGLSFSVHRMRQTLGLGTTDAPIAVAEHRRIYEAVKANDKALAVKAMTEHLQNVAQRSVA